MTIMALVRRLGLAIALLALGASIAPAQFTDQRTYGATSGGSLNAQTILIPNYTLKVGIPLRFIAGFTNTASTTLTVSNQTGSLGAITVKKLTPSGLQNLSGREIHAGETVVVIYDGTNFQLLAPNFSAVPTYTVLITGSGTYNPPTGATYLKVRMCGGAAGGGGSGSAGQGNGGIGGDTTLGSITAKGSTAGQANSSTTPGAAGTGGTAGSGSPSVRLSGGDGVVGAFAVNNYSGTSASGADSPFGGGGKATDTTGGSAKANTCSGGAGASNNQASFAGGGSAGAGEYVEFQIIAASLSYAVGAAGTAGGAGTSGWAGGVGSAGLIIIEEHYD